MADEIPTEALEAAAEVIRQRLDDLGTEGRDVEGTLDGSLWLDGLDSVAEDLACTVAPFLIAEGRRQRDIDLFTVPLITDGDDETPSLMSRYERELRAKIAAEIRSRFSEVVDRAEAMAGTATGAVLGCEWAARIAEGTDHG